MDIIICFLQMEKQIDREYFAFPKSHSGGWDRDSDPGSLTLNPKGRIIGK